MSGRGVTRQPDRQRGVSLIELMVAVVVGLLLLGGLIQVYLSNKQSYNAQEQLARMQESGRFAMDMITRDLRRSGYWGGNVDLDTINLGNPGPVAPAHDCDAGLSAWGRMIAWRVSGLDDSVAGYASCASDYLAGDILAVRYAGPAPVAAVSNDGRLYLRSTLFVGRVMTGAQAGHADNQLPSDPAAIPQHLLPVVRPLVSSAFYVGTSSQTCRGAAVPALWRIGLSQAGLPVAEELVPGVEQLQVRYLLGDEYLDADAIANDEWRAVSAVRVWLLVRSECPEPDLQNDTTYAMADTPFVANDNFRRQLYVSTVMLRNIRVR